MSFNSRAPARGATDAIRSHTETLRFQFTRPSAGRDRDALVSVRGKCVSIHAPQRGARHPPTLPKIPGQRFQFTRPSAGRDSRAELYLGIDFGFNSRAPARGATSRSRHALREEWVSIHAPQRGARRLTRETLPNERGFNSRAPARGATTAEPVFRGGASGFNSRAPARGATLSCRITFDRFRFQFTRPSAGRDMIRFGAMLIQVEFQFTRPSAGRDRRARLYARR